MTAKRTGVMNMKANRTDVTNMDAIRRAVMMHHGGWDDATDEQIMGLWRQLDIDVQQRYLAAAKATTTPGTPNTETKPK